MHFTCWECLQKHTVQPYKKVTYGTRHTIPFPTNHYSTNQTHDAIQQHCTCTSHNLHPAPSTFNTKYRSHNSWRCGPSLPRTTVPLLVYPHPCTTTGAPTPLYHLCCTNTPVPQHPGLASHSVTIPAPHPARCHHLIPRPPGHPITLSPTRI